MNLINETIIKIDWLSVDSIEHHLDAVDKRIVGGTIGLKWGRLTSNGGR